MTDPRWSWLLIPLAGAALGVGGYAWGHSSVPAKRAAVVTSDAERIALLEDEVRRLRAQRQQVSVSPQQAAPEADPVAAADPSDAGEPVEAEAPAEDPEEQERRANEERNRHFDALSRLVDTEIVDGRWRHETEQPLEELMTRHLGPEITVSEATCASTLCRVKLAHPALRHIPATKMFPFDMARGSLQVTEVQYDIRSEGATTLYFKRGPAPASIPATTEPG